MYDREKREKRIDELVGEFPRIFKGKAPHLGFGTNAGWDGVLQTLFTDKRIVAAEMFDD